MTDIFEALTDEHERHRTLLDLIEKTEGDSGGRRELFSRLVLELRSHANAEERTLYAAMMAIAESQPDSSHSVHEHQQIEDFLSELTDTDLSSSGWIVTFRKLAERTRHHMREEEDNTFPAGRKVMTQKKADELGERFFEEKNAEVESMTA